MKKFSKFIILAFATSCLLFSTACNSLIPTYYSKTAIKNFANKMFDSPQYVGKSKNGTTRVYTFTDEYGRPFALESEKHNAFFFQPGDMPYLYTKYFYNRYECDILAYEEENVVDIIESYGFDYTIKNGWAIYILIPYEYYDNPDETVTQMAEMLTEIDAVLNYNFDQRAVDASVGHGTSTVLAHLMLEPGENYLEDNPTYDFTEDEESKVMVKSFSLSPAERMDSKQLEDEISQKIDKYISK